MWMSRPSGTVLSIVVRNFLNSVVRCWRCTSEMTLPSAMLNAAANRLVIPCQAWRPEPLAVDVESRGDAPDPGSRYGEEAASRRLPGGSLVRTALLGWLATSPMSSFSVNISHTSPSFRKTTSAEVETNRNRLTISLTDGIPFSSGAGTQPAHHR